MVQIIKNELFLHFLDWRCFTLCDRKESEDSIIVLFYKEKENKTMQTRQPKRRVNWIFVGSLIVAFPLILFTLFMMNVLPPHSKGTTSGIDSVQVDSVFQNRHGQDSSNIKRNENNK